MHKKFQLSVSILRASKALQEPEGGIYSVGGGSFFNKEGFTVYIIMIIDRNPRCMNNLGDVDG